MGKWMDLAAQLEAASDIGDNRDIRDVRGAIVPNVPNVPVFGFPTGALQAKAAMNAPAAPAKGAKAPSDPFEGEPTGRFTGLPSELSDGLRRLAIMPAPGLIIPEAWPTAVSGALGLARDGWAEKALTLGWPALDLFGAVPDPAGDPEGDGLAVWLAGRKVLVLDEVCAVARDACGSRFYFHRPRAAGAVLMWNLGRGR